MARAIRWPHGVCVSCDRLTNTTEALMGGMHRIRVRGGRGGRARMRDQEKNLDPIQLAYGLGSYSQRGDNYIDEVQTIIQQNDLRLRDDG